MFFFVSIDKDKSDVWKGSRIRFDSELFTLHVRLNII